MPTYALRADLVDLDTRVDSLEAGTVADATETTAGKAEIATQSEVGTGTDDSRIVTPLKLATRLTNVLPVAATTTDAGIVELATTAEAAAGTDTTRAVTPAGLAAYGPALGFIARSTDGTQTLTSGAIPTVLWQTETTAARGGISYNSGTGVFTVTQPGTYLVTAYLQVTADTVGRRFMQIRHNATLRAALNSAATSAGTGGLSVSAMFDAVASDVIDVRVLQDSGSTLNVLTAGYVAIRNLG